MKIKDRKVNFVDPSAKNYQDPKAGGEKMRNRRDKHGNKIDKTELEKKGIPHY
jgi:hypothetical protein